MAGGINRIKDGSVTSAKGYEAGATFAGLKTFTEDKLDLGILLSRRPTTAAGVFTTNRFKSPSVLVTEKHIADGKAHAVVVNSGIANACVGEPGYKDAQRMAAKTASRWGLQPEDVLVCSTGVVGVELPMSLIETGIDRIELSEDGGNRMARAILTTDPGPKEIAVAFELNGKTVTIGGNAKGAGMIHPNMATMLSFIATDAEVSPDLLKQMLREAADESFNMMTIDGDTSTNDTVLLMANGAAEAGPIVPGSEGAQLFAEALNQVCVHLAKAIAREGEGSTKLIEVIVEGAKTMQQARSGARTIAGSSLVKTAVHGNDPNWGRIVVALGRSDAEVVESKLALYINDICIMEDGVPIPFHRDSVIAIMARGDVIFRLNLNVGDCRATAWGCNLSEEYVTFNSAYTT